MSEEGARKSDESDRMAEKEQLRLRWDIKESTCTQQISKCTCIINITRNYQLREESEDLLKQLRISVEAERMEERDRLEAEKRQEMEPLKKESELELQAASKKLEELKESAQKEMEKEKQKLRSDIRVTHCISFLILHSW